MPQRIGRLVPDSLSVPPASRKGQGSTGKNAGLEPFKGQTDSKRADVPPTPEPSAELQKRLDEKEQLVKALTEQLELAAEQLDRFQRSGANQRTAVAGGLPPALLEDQKQVLDDMARVVQQWEDMQAAMVLGRLEVQISSLQDLIHEKLNQPFMVAQASVAMVRPGIETAANEGPEAQLDAESTGAWAALKQRMLAQQQPEATAPAKEATSLVVECPEEPPPRPLEVSAASREQLEEAIDDRDRYISYLLRRQRLAGGEVHLPDWSSLPPIPEVLTNRVTQLADELESRLRLAEIEVSVERARIARDQMKLRQAQDALERQRRQLGIENESAAASNNSGSAPASSSDRRWSRFMGNTRRTE